MRHLIQRLSVLAVGAILLLTACDTVIEAGVTKTARQGGPFARAIEEVESLYGISLGTTYTRGEPAPDSRLIQVRKYGPTEDGTVVRFFMYSDARSDENVFWEVSKEPVEADTTARDVDLAGLEKASTRSSTSPTEIFTQVVANVGPMADDPGGGTNGYNCVDYCRVIQKTYAVYEYSIWVPVVEIMTATACSLVGGAIGGPVGGVAGGIYCTVLMLETWKEIVLIDTECLDWSIACSDHQYQAPTVPKPIVRKV